jgi:hypothetical protein
MLIELHTIVFFHAGAHYYSRHLNTVIEKVKRRPKFMPVDKKIGFGVHDNKKIVCLAAYILFSFYLTRF